MNCKGLEEVGIAAFAPNWRTQQAGAAAPGPCSRGDSQGATFNQKSQQLSSS